VSKVDEDCADFEAELRIMSDLFRIARKHQSERIRELARDFGDAIIELRFPGEPDPVLPPNLVHLSREAPRCLSAATAPRLTATLGGIGAELSKLSGRAFEQHCSRGRSPRLYTLTSAGRSSASAPHWIGSSPAGSDMVGSGWPETRSPMNLPQRLNSSMRWGRYCARL
jgi:hypothetical protein